ncbi:hypothetical protein WJX81_003828 [Elliptochloris bilobata]|uniref:hydroxyacylglutathione hydrolase n=1 Tax=Elliptochloris bilobata TaxID=381761 RepID=A0AAW1RC60_9CHLO
MTAEEDTSTRLTALTVDRVSCLSDNYAWLLREESGKVAIVDPSEAQPVIRALESRNLKLDYIMNTHHHWDHVGGNEELKRRYGAQVVGPAADRDRIPGIDIALAGGESWQLGSLEMRVIDVPGHTRGHVAFWFPQAEALFSGDTLFALGCGRLFEGTPKQMWQSLAKLRELPPSTSVFCGHEYTQSNARFAEKIDGDNAALNERSALINSLREQGKATVPSLLSEELETNPFLRPSSAAIRDALGVPEMASDAEVFAAIRAAKDRA